MIPRPFYFLLILAIVVGGCASRNQTPFDSKASEVSPGGLQGTWLYAFAKRSVVNMPPPTFDVMEFKPGGLLTLKDTMTKRTFDGQFSCSSNRLALSFNVPDSVAPIKLDLQVALTDQEQELSVSDADQECIFYREDRFLRNDIAGTWSTIDKGAKDTMMLGSDASYRLPNEHVVGYYRMWPSRYGNVATTAFNVPGEGAFTLLQQYARHGNLLTFTAIGPEGPIKDSATVFTLEKTEK